MKTLTKTHGNTGLKKRESHNLAHLNSARAPKVYQQKRTLNLNLLVLCLSFVVGAFFLGTQYGKTPQTFTIKEATQSAITFYESKNSDITAKLEYKDINFDSYLDQLNNREFIDYAEYLAHKSYVYDQFREDLRHNSNVFNATHQITGKDSRAYVEFKQKQREIRVQFKRVLDQHQSYYRDFMRTKRRVSKL